MFSIRKLNLSQNSRRLPLKGLKLNLGQVRCQFNLKSPKFFATLLLIVAALCFATLCLRKTFAGMLDPAPYIDLSSQNTVDGAGSWHIKKLAGWTGEGKARIAFNVDTEMKLNNENSDLILVVDTAASYYRDDGDAKLTRVKDGLSRLVEEFLSWGDNRIALVSFAANYRIISDLTSDKAALLSGIESLSGADESTNYYQGLNGAEKLLQNYAASADRDIVISLITDGAPDEEPLYHRAEYELLKRLHPSVVVNAVQYNMGSQIHPELAAISENQFTATDDTLTDAISDAALAPNNFTQFVLTDLVEDKYFTIPPDGIEADKGSFTLVYDGDTPRITWDLSGALRSGFAANLQIDLELKPEYRNQPIDFETNKYTAVQTSLRGVPDEYVTTTESPIIYANYSVQYDANSPSGCTAQGIPDSEVHYVYTTVEVSATVPTCTGYNFAGYKILNGGIVKLNDDYFRMPNENVYISATWTKLNLEKAMDGEVYVPKTLYNEMAKRSLRQGTNGAYNIDSDIRFSAASSATNGDGVNTIADTINDTYPIHYFRGNVTDNNVLFADICWKAMRTTDTGGVKLVYNGEADIDGRCLDTRSDSYGFGTTRAQDFSRNYYYGTDYTYNEETKTFSLGGIKVLAKWSDDVADSLIGQYTCKSDNESASCATLYRIASKRDAKNAYATAINSGIPYNAVGKLQYNVPGAPLSMMGYMYGQVHSPGATNFIATAKLTTDEVVLKNAAASTDFWYADSVEYGETVANKYSLESPYQVASADDYSSLVGKYTFRANQNNYSNNAVYYIAAVSDAKLYFLELRYGQSLVDVDTSYMFGDSIVDNGDGTYTLQNPIEIKKTAWPTEYESLEGKFTCGNTTDTRCETPRYLVSTSVGEYAGVDATQDITLGKGRDDLELTDAVTIKLHELAASPEDYSDYKYTCHTASTTCAPGELRLVRSFAGASYEYVNNVIFGASVSWDGEKYTLNDTIGLENYSNTSAIAYHHFFCTNYGNTTCDTVAYIYHGSSRSWYISLTGGTTTPGEAIDLMRQNLTSSSAKYAVDAWYERRLSSYGAFIEDTVYCNDRSIYNYAGWNPDGGSISSNLSYKASKRQSAPTLQCERKEDAFTVSEENGNGDLTYPVALLSEDEVILAGHGSSGNKTAYLYSGDWSWTMTPNYMYFSGANVHAWDATSYARSVDFTSLLRPVISVVNEMLITEGDGSTTNPYRISSGQ